jgi:hypothetical protein
MTAVLLVAEAQSNFLTARLMNDCELQQRKTTYERLIYNSQ